MSALSQKMDNSGSGIKAVDDPVIAGAQPVAVAAGQPVVGKGGQPQPHCVYPGLNARSDYRREFEKRRVKWRVINLDGRAHWPRQALRTRGRRPVAISRSDCWIAASKSSLNSSRSSTKSFSRFLSLTRTPTSVTLQFTGAAGTVYSLQRAGAAAGPYKTRGTATADTSGAATYIDNAPLPGAGFYRISYP